MERHQLFIIYLLSAKALSDNTLISVVFGLDASGYKNTLETYFNVRPFCDIGNKY